MMSDYSLLANRGVTLTLQPLLEENV